MGDRIEGTPGQLRAGAATAAPALARISPERPRRLVLFGMGGSAIAGDLLRVLADREGSVPVHVIRHYDPPAWISPEDLLVFSSYSGGTEETLSAYRALRGLGARSVVVTTGGTLGFRAAEDGIPAAILPSGHPPRAALGYSFATLAHVAEHVGVLASVGRRLEAAARGVEEVVSGSARGVLQSRNFAKKLAIRLGGRAVLLFGGDRSLAPVALRWKGQLNENSKQLAWASPLPEMNHNEVDGFANPRSLMGRLAAVLLRDQEDHPRIKERFEWLRGYLVGRGVRVETVTIEGGDPMTRLLVGVAMGDFVSYYLALANGANPSSLPGVEALKKALRT
jgi:glucose/mannose-6-phosphate isomerase